MSVAANLNEPTLLERGEELARIERALQAARDGIGALVLVEGSAGMGKTRLVLTARQLAGRAGLRVLSARGSPLERELAYGCMRQLFQPVLGRAGHGVLAGAAALAASVFASGMPLVHEASADQVFAVLHGLYWVTADLLQDGPMLLAVDDAHWADRASLRFLAYLAHRREGLPLALVIATRPAESPAEEEVLVSLASDPHVVSIMPAPLSRTAVADLLRRELDVQPEPEFVEACRRATGGVPFLVTELIREVRARGLRPAAAASDQVEGLGPRSVTRVVVARLRRLGDDALALARAVAVLGADAEPARAGRLAGVELEAPLDALDGVGLVSATRPVEFTHPIIRSAIDADIPAGERALLHARAARMLDGEGLGPERVANHLLLANPGGDPWVPRVLVDAARLAASRGAAGSAVSYLERALAEPPAGDTLVDVLHELGRAEAAQANPAALSRHLGRALQVCTVPERRGRIGLDLGRALASAGDFPGAVQAFEQALAGAPDRGGKERRRAEAELLTIALNHYESTQAARPLLLRRLQDLAAGQLNDPALLAVLGMALAVGRPPAAAGAEIAARAARSWEPELGSVVPGCVRRRCPCRKSHPPRWE